MLNDAILARGVEPLQHHQQRLPGIRVKQILRLAQPFEVLRDLVLRLSWIRAFRYRMDRSCPSHLGLGADHEFLAISHPAAPMPLTGPAPVQCNLIYPCCLSCRFLWGLKALSILEQSTERP